MLHHPGSRLGLYLALSLFSIVLLALTATRIHTSNNNGVVVELLVTTILAILWSWLLMHTIHSARSRGPVSTFLHELIGLLILWTMFLIGTAIATHRWANLSFCLRAFQCRLLSTIVAFSWLNFITTTLLLFSILSYFSSRSRGSSGSGGVYNDHLHGKGDPDVNPTTTATTTPHGGNHNMTQNPAAASRV